MQMRVDLKPLKGEREECFDGADAAKAMVNMVNAEGFDFINKDQLREEALVLKANAKLDAMLNVIAEKRDEMIRFEKEITEQTKKIGSSIRNQAERLAQSFAKFEKEVNLDQLTQRANDLERIACALESIANLHTSGKLENIGNMLKK